MKRLGIRDGEGWGGKGGRARGKNLNKIYGSLSQLFTVGMGTAATVSQRFANLTSCELYTQFYSNYKYLAQLIFYKTDP